MARGDGESEIDRSAAIGVAQAFEPVGFGVSGSDRRTDCQFSGNRNAAIASLRLRRLASALLACAFVSTIRAQYVDLRAPGDGAELYYSLAIPRPAPGSSPNANPKSIYKIGSESATLVTGTIESPWIPRGFYGFGYLTDYYQHSLPQFSTDLTVDAYTSRRDCLGRAELCTGNRDQLLQTTVLRGNNAPMTYPGAGWLSANGRYLFTLDNRGFNVAIVDLQTGTIVSPLVYGVAYDQRRARVVSNSGEIVVDYGAAPPSKSIISVNGFEAAMDADGSHIVFVAQDRGSLQVLSRPAQLERTLLSGSAVSAPAISADGVRVMFLLGFSSTVGAGPQIQMINIDGTGLRDLTGAYEPAGVANFAMSDDGLAAWYASPSGTITKIDLHFGQRSPDHISPCGG